MKHTLLWYIETLIGMHTAARVGHLGGSLSCITGLYAIAEVMAPRDRLVLSKGHAAGALYVHLAARGEIGVEELTTFHGNGTRLPGHPPAGTFPSVPFATGSLGHGLSLAAGFALSQKLRGGTERTYCLMSDGEWQEGSTWEALIFSCHHALSYLTILVDHNGLQGFGNTAAVASMNPLWERIRGFDVDTAIVNGHDPAAIAAALEPPQTKPRIIFLKTIKGWGVPGMEGQLLSHYLPPSPKQSEEALDFFRRTL